MRSEHDFTEESYHEVCHPGGGVGSNIGRVPRFSDIFIFGGGKERHCFIFSPNRVPSYPFSGAMEENSFPP